MTAETTITQSHHHEVEVTEQARAAAYQRIKAKRDFGAHLVVYVVVNAFLVVVWLLSGAGYFWPVWVMAPWAIGLVLNWWDVYVRKPITDADVEAELRRQRPAE